MIKIQIKPIVKYFVNNILKNVAKARNFKISENKFSMEPIEL